MHQLAYSVSRAFILGYVVYQVENGYLINFVILLIEILIKTTKNIVFFLDKYSGVR